MQESLGFSPNELIFGHTVRGPLKVLKEKFMDACVSSETNVVDFVSKLRGRLNKACSLAREFLSSSQKSMKERFDKAADLRARIRGCSKSRLTITCVSLLSASN